MAIRCSETHISQHADSVNRRRPIDGESASHVGWLQNAWLLHARLKILTGGLTPGSEPTQKTRGPVH
jgi:hypothetical protein